MLNREQTVGLTCTADAAGFASHDLDQVIIHASSLNISQQLMDDFFTMIILVDTSKCPKSRQEMLDLFAEESKKLALDIRMQNEEIFQAMHRI